MFGGKSCVGNALETRICDSWACPGMSLNLIKKSYILIYFHNILSSTKESKYDVLESYELYLKLMLQLISMFSVLKEYPVHMHLNNPHLI